MTKTLIAAALLGAALVTPALANQDPPHGGPCHVYWKPSPIAGVDQPFVLCDS